MGEIEWFVTEILEEATESETEPMDDAEPKDVTVPKAKKEKKDISSNRIFAFKKLTKKCFCRMILLKITSKNRSH
jgi:hypothetical protein